MDELFVEVIDGEVVDDESVMEHVRISYNKKLVMVDPIWCETCRSVTWQQYQNSEYVCDHSPESKAPHKRRLLS